MQFLQGGIGTITGIALAIIGQADRLMRWLDTPKLCHPLQRIGAVQLRFVNIVPKVHQQIEIIAGSSMGIGIEPARCRIGAGKYADPELVQRTFGQSACAPGGRNLAGVGAESIIIPVPRLEIVWPGMNAEILVRRGQGRRA